MEPGPGGYENLEGQEKTKIIATGGFTGGLL